MNTFDEAFTQSTDAVFGINEAGRIHYTNKKFERLTGYSRKQLCGIWCAEVLCGTDIYGRPFCGPHCPIPKTVVDQPSIGDFDLMIKCAKHDRVLVNIGASYISSQQQGEAGRVDVYFSMRQVNPRQLLQRMALAPSVQNGLCEHGQLTKREKEVLSLAVKGRKTSQIAHHLSIHTQTVRSHFRSIYSKLGVNSRSEAIVIALKQGLV